MTFHERLVVSLGRSRTEANHGGRLGIEGRNVSTRSIHPALLKLNVLYFPFVC